MGGRVIRERRIGACGKEERRIGTCPLKERRKEVEYTASYVSFCLCEVKCVRREEENVKKHRIQ